jgi:hypothetical protein
MKNAFSVSIWLSSIDHRPTEVCLIPVVKWTPLPPNMEFMSMYDEVMSYYPEILFSKKRE